MPKKSALPSHIGRGDWYIAPYFAFIDVHFLLFRSPSQEMVQGGFLVDWLQIPDVRGPLLRRDVVTFAMFLLAAVTYLLIAILAQITWQTQFVLARPRITMRQLLVYIFGVAVATCQD